MLNMAHRHMWIAILILFVLCFMIDSSTAEDKDARYIGCYEDNNSFRATGWVDYTSRVSAPMTVDACVTVCAGEMTLLAGLINGNSCWCSNNTVFNRTKCSGRGCCNAPCHGNASQTCGGRESFVVYEAVVESRYLGCYLRYVGFYPYRDTPSTDHCIVFCGREGFRFAGTQARRTGIEIECWCGLNPRYHKDFRCISEHNCICDTPCGHRLSEKCGTVIRSLSLYKAECKEQGKWGKNCENTCHCINGAGCRMHNGECPNDECAPGWNGTTCGQECENGNFGVNCAQQCHCLNSATCDRRTGQCPDGICAGGYKYNSSDKTCQTECENGTFGVNCAQQCHCLNSLSCDRRTGRCPDGICAGGYNLTDKTCQTECQTGTYGVACGQKCECSNIEDCDKVTGECEDKVNVLVPTISSLLGVALLVIAIFVAVFLWRRRNQEMAHKAQHHEEEPYHFYHDITDTPADQAPKNNKILSDDTTKSTQDIGCIYMTPVSGQSKYVNIGGDELYENANHMNDDGSRNSVYEDLEKPK